jgi:DNA-binding CsgD family transcriptional regulator
MLSQSLFQVVVASPASWLAEAMCRWLELLGPFVTCCASDTSSCSCQPHLILVVDDGSEPRGPMRNEKFWPACPRVYLAAALSPPCLLEALRLQAVAILPSSEAQDWLVPTLLAALRGHPCSPPWLLLKLFPLPPEAHSRRRTTSVRLSVRELEIGCALARGQSYEQIAEHQYISRSTVKYHVRQLLEKLALPDRYAIAAHFNQRIPFCPPILGR